MVAALVGAAILYKLLTVPGIGDELAVFLLGMTKPLLVPVVLAIGSPAFVTVMSIAIVAAALAACGWYWFVVTAARRKRVRGTIRALAKLARRDTESGKRAEADGIWNELAAIVPRNGFFANSWSLFSADWQSERGRARLPFSWYVAKDPAIAAGGRAGMMAALPGYFTTVGLILTFIGLVVALYFAARGFRSGSMEEAHQAIVQLLAASSFKFLTSVAALIGALTISLFARFADRRLSNDIAEASQLVDQLCATLPQARAAPSDPGAAILARLDRLVALMETATAGQGNLAKPASPLRSVPT